MFASSVGVVWLIIAACLLIGWIDHVLTRTGKHCRRLPAYIHVLWVSVAFIYLFFGTDMVT